MSEPRYQIVSHGNLRPGFSAEQVAKNLSEQMKLTDKVIERLISSNRTVVKRSLGTSAAHQYEQKFFLQGLIVKTESMLTESGSLSVSLDSPTADNLEVQNSLPVEETNDSRFFESDASLAGSEASGHHVTPGEQPNDYGPGYPKIMSFEFTGNGKEYFKIWIVNIVLTILTLGIYSAWAKVRNKQYFYGNTVFDDATFEYTAKPLQILKGRILAFIVVGVYFGLQQFLPPLYQLYFLPFAIIFFVAIFPWVVVKGLQFNARHSTYRNISFGFDGSYWGAFKAFILWPLAGITGILLPFAWHRKNNYFVNNSRYGTSPFQFTATVSDYYRILGIMIALGLGLGVAFFIVSMVAAFIPYAGVVIIFLAYLAIYIVLGAYYGVSANNLLYNSTLLKQHSLTSSYDLKSYAALIFTNTLGILLTLGIFIPWALVRSARYHAEKTNFVAAEDLDNFIAAEEQHVNTLAEGLADTHDMFDIDVGI
jgi:uncharacterized membrane protein YjgN (DUF898 family)